MRYIVRADASQSMGSGHVMRTSSIAEELIARGQLVIFVGQITDIPWLVLRINSLGFSRIFSDPQDFVSNKEKDVLILDSYALFVSDVFIQPEKWNSVVLVADKLTPAYPADLIIRPGLSTDFVETSGAKVLAGTKYIPFRKSIQKIVRNASPEGSLEILVVGGGTDSLNFVGAISKVLMGVPDNFHAIIFTNNPELSTFDSRLTVVSIGSELDEYVKTAQLVFTTASTTSLEFIACEVALGIGCAVDNQEQYYENLSLFEVAAPIGRYIEGNWQLDHAKIAELVHSSDTREDLRKNCAGLVDLGGAGRIVDEILML